MCRRFSHTCTHTHKHVNKQKMKLNARSLRSGHVLCELLYSDHVDIIHHIGEYTIPSLLVLASLWHSLGFLHLCLYPKNITVPHTRHQHGTYHHLLIHSQFLDVRLACHPQCQCQDKSLQHLISSRHLMSHHVWYLFKSVLLFFPVPSARYLLSCPHNRKSPYCCHCGQNWRIHPAVRF